MRRTVRSSRPEARLPREHSRPAFYPSQPIRWGLGLEFMPEPDGNLSGSFRAGLACKRKRTSTHARLVGQAYNWPVENLILSIHESPDYNLGLSSMMSAGLSNLRPTVICRGA